MPRSRAAAWIPALLVLAGVVRAEPPPAPHPLDLAACRQLARQQQPALAAYRATLAKAEANARALDHLVLVEVVRKDLPCRRQQAAHGIVIARALLAQAEGETIYAITRTYLTALFAREQQRVADEGISELETLLKNLPEKERDHPQIKRLEVLLELVRGRRTEAVNGYQRALAALAEAIGLEGPEGLAIAGDRLPDLDPPLDPRQLYDLSLERRPEMTEAGEMAEVAALEVQAQGAVHGVSLETFAAGADLHAEPLPPWSLDGEYRPKAVGPEMPTTLVGCKADRVAQARALSARASAVAAKTRNLISLEARDTLARWQGTKTKRGFSRKGAEAARKEATGLVDDFKNSRLLPDNPRFGTALAQVIDAGILSAVAGIEDNQARFDFLLILAKLEQITAGTFCPGFE